MKKHSNSADDWGVLNNRFTEEIETPVKKNDFYEVKDKFDELSRFKHLLNDVNDGILVVDMLTGKVVDANLTACNLFDLPINNNFSVDINEVIQKCSTPVRLLKTIKSSGKNDNKIIKTHLNRKDGNKQPVEVSVKASSYQNKKYSIVVIRDIKEKIDTEQKLILAKEEAEKSNYLKAEFLAQISHEIRTPLNSILNFISLMKEELEDKASDELKSCFKIIDNGSKRIIRTIDLILDMSQIQTGNYEGHFKKIDLSKDILENLILDFYLLSKGKNISLRFDNSSNEPFIYGDTYSISQIFLNLIENAIKYTSEGQIEVNLYEKSGKIIVDIKDTGIGISSEYLSHLFTPFTQEEMGYTRNFEGTGLGLALVKKYVELNNAEIRVKSAKGKGSCFSIIFDKYRP